MTKTTTPEALERLIPIRNGFFAIVDPEDVDYGDCNIQTEAQQRASDIDGMTVAESMRHMAELTEYRR